MKCLLRVAREMNYFSACHPIQTRVNVYRDYINAVLRDNANEYKQPPMDYSRVMEAARRACQAYGQPSCNPVDYTYIKVSKKLHPQTVYTYS